jgi:hypothetical protein
MIAELTDSFISEARCLRCRVQLLTAGIPSWAVAGAGIDLAGGVPDSTGHAAGHCEIPWFGYFAVARSGAFAIAHSGVNAWLLAVGGTARLPPIAASENAPVLGEHRRGNGREKKYCGAKRFDFGHLSFSCLI